MSVLMLTVGTAVGAQTLPTDLDELLGDYTVTTWSYKEGLPAGRIRAIAQDRDGYLWLGTDVGLFRFDGVRFVAWELREHAERPIEAVMALLSSRDGSLWIGTGSRGLARIRDGTLSTYAEREAFGRAFVFSLAEDHNGTIWAGTFEGLYRFRSNHWEKLGPREGLSPVPVLAVYEDRQRRLWIATPAAVLRSTNEGNFFQKVDEIETSGDTRQHFSEDSDGTIWLTDFRAGFRAAVNRMPPGQLPRRRGWGVHLLHDRRGNFWVATLGQGLWRVRPDTRAQQPIVETITVREGLSSDAVQTLLEDREGNVWVGTRAGLQRLSPRRVRPLTDLPIPRAMETTSDGSVWVGTAAGLTRFSAAGRQQYGERDGLPGSVVSALHTDESGVLWIATDRGLAHFANGRFSPFVAQRSSQMERILIITSSHDTVWFRDLYLGLFRGSGGVLVPADMVPEPLRRTAQALHTDKNGNIWIGSAGGILGVSGSNGHFQSYELDIGNIRSIYEDATGMLWVGGDDGLSRFSGGQFVSVNRQNGFPGNVRSIAEDEEGCLWLGLGSGIVRLERGEFVRASADRFRQVQYRLFSTADGVAGSPIAVGSRSAVRASDGKLWFVTSAGVTIVDPRNLGAPPSPPPVRIESVTADARRLDVVSQAHLPPGTSHIQVVFTALTLTDPIGVRFRYRLDGFDRDWIEAGTNRQASYTNLPPRAYRFRVVASGNDGIWNEAAAVWDFAIDPMFYQTNWFYAVGGLTVLLIAGVSWQIRVRQVRSQFALVLAERIRMSRAIHDTLLQGLVGLGMQFDDLSHDLDSSPAVQDRVLRIRREVRDQIREARHSIQDLRSPTLETSDLVLALQGAAERAKAGTPVHVEVSVAGSPQPILPTVEEHILYIGREALNNAVRHAQPTRIGVELCYDENHLRLRVSDDGCGFNLEAAQRAGGHYGLVSMQERAEHLRASFRIVTNIGRGTEVEIVVPIT
jgi:signal transduction histidine kinase/ligand-binding sensor domain-containing protein